MKKIYNSKAFWMIVSLLASLAILVYVTSVETDESKTTFRGVKVELVGEDILRDSKNLVVTELRQCIFHARRDFGIDGAGEQAVSLH